MTRHFARGLLAAGLYTSCATAPVVPSAPPAAGRARVAAVQYEIRAGRSVDDVLEATEAAVDRARRAGATLVVFPELFVLDVWPDTVNDEAAFIRSVAETVTPRVLASTARVAKRYEVAVLVGSMPTVRAGQLYNTAHLFFPDGRVVRQDKMFLTAWGRRVGMRAGESLETFEAPWGRSVILVCYDVEFPVLSQALVASRPEVILVPSMTESVYGLRRVRWAAQARAVEHHAYVVVAATVGRPSDDWLHFGQSVFLTPQDRGFAGVLSEGPRDRPAIVYGDLDLEKLRASRKDATFYPAQDQRASPRPRL